MKQFYNLSGQNLLRHKLIESHFRNYGFDSVVSDSVHLNQLIALLCTPKKKLAFHFLELYSFSFIAFFSEFKFRLFGANFRLASIAQILFYFFKLFIRILLFRLIIKRNDALVLSSELRKNFIKKIGFRNPVFVLRNKPVYSQDDIIKYNFPSRERAKIIVLTGNLNNRIQFFNLCKIINNTDIKVYCYGISVSDKEWVLSQDFCNVVVCDSIPSHDIPYVLLSSLYAICFYDEASINQKYSASSKLFEILFWGAIPIVSSNAGILDELDELGANYIKAHHFIRDYSNFKKMESNTHMSEVCLFSNEIDNLNLNTNNGLPTMQ